MRYLALVASAVPATVLRRNAALRQTGPNCWSPGTGKVDAKSLPPVDPVGEEASDRFGTRKHQEVGGARPHQVVARGVVERKARQ